jgi:hypothetical protein
MWEILTGEEPYANMQFGAIIGQVLIDWWNGFLFRLPKNFFKFLLFFLTLCLIWIRVCMCDFLFSLIFENGLLLRLKSKFKTLSYKVWINPSRMHKSDSFPEKLIVLENKLCVSLCHICSRWFNTSACHCFMFFLSDFRQGSNHCELWMKAEL